MKKYKKIYFDYFGYCKDEKILCEICGREAVDIHHIQPKGIGGSKNEDYIENLIALCRDCHTAAHEHSLSKELLTKIHISNLF